MAYTLTTITIKPTSTVWYSDSGGTSAADAAAYRAWIKTNTGFMTSYSVRMAEVRPNTHTAIKNVSVWETFTDYDAFVVERETQPYYIALQAYNVTNGIVAVDSKTRG